MAQYKFKNLPSGFEFPSSKHEIRSFVETTSANFDLIEFDGLSSTESYYSKNRSSTLHFVCYLNEEFREDEWVFKLEVNGLRLERYEGRREEIAPALLEQIRKWVDGKIALPTTAPRKPCRAHVYFDLNRGPGEIAELLERS